MLIHGYYKIKRWIVIHGNKLIQIKSRKILKDLNGEFCVFL
jgi:hypothetical protein